MGLAEGHSHLHASVSENTYYTDRKKCFTGADSDEVLEDAKDWLNSEIESDSGQEPKEGSWSEVSETIISWDGHSEGTQANILIPGNREGYGVTMGYRLMWVDGDCDETI